MSDRLEQLPNKGPRPEGELEELRRIWASPKGWQLPTAVNNTVIGTLYIGRDLRPSSPDIAATVPAISGEDLSLIHI